MVAIFAATGGTEAAPLASQQPQPEEELERAVDDLLAQSVNSLFLRGESWAAELLCVLRGSGI